MGLQNSKHTVHMFKNKTKNDPENSRFVNQAAYKIKN